MSRIGKKPIALPAGVKYTVEGNTVLVEGPKGKVTALIAPGISLVKEGDVLNIERESDKAANTSSSHDTYLIAVFKDDKVAFIPWKRTKKSHRLLSSYNLVPLPNTYLCCVEVRVGEFGPQILAETDP